MEHRQQILYDNLMKLCADENSNFHFKPVQKNNHDFRVFSYRLATFSEWLLPDARECRGHMFAMYENVPTRLVSLPMHKFFNLYENPLTMDIDIANMEWITVKEDGSLISTFLDGSALEVKSKTSLYSTMAIHAREILYNDKKLFNFCIEMEYNGYTVNMEYVSPLNRIILPYTKSALRVINVRNRYSFEYMNYYELVKLMKDMKVESYLVNNELDKYKNIDNFVESVYTSKGIEGYVFKSGPEIVKIKTKWYTDLHYIRFTSMASPLRIFKLVVEDCSDDIKSSFGHDKDLINSLLDMEKFVHDIYVDVEQCAIKFYNENKELDIKSFAIKGKKELPIFLFNIAMMERRNNSLDLKSYMIRWASDNKSKLPVANISDEYEME